MRAAILSTLSLAAFCRLANGKETLQARASNWTIGQTVQTSSGPVNGHAASRASQVSEYLGIPYAMPPIGDLRFAAPQPYSSTDSTINGTSFGFSCPAAANTANITQQNLASANITVAGVQVLGTLAEFSEQFSEDCLTVNVWTKPQTGEAKKAVLVWIYGGSFTSGSSASPAYNGQFIADQEDVVLVSFNYRLNIFGFPGSPNTTQNLGLLDQRLAIEWVHSNIASFGGDPNRITLFGQSAGGASVDYYTYAWTENPLASSFISESGTAIGLGQQTAAESAASWYNVSSKLNCGDASSDAASVLSCMRTKNYTSLLNALSMDGVFGSVGFGPTIDEVVVFSDYLNRSAAGNFVKAPLLIGNADNEAGIFRLLAALEGVSSQYPDEFWTDFNAVVFVCPGSTRANASISHGLPTWRYRWFGVFPNTIIETNPQSGAWHASELPILFDTYPSGSSVPNATAPELAIASYFRGAWATFAKDPVNGLSSYSGSNGTGWPTYNPYGDTLVRLAFANQTGPNLAPGTAYDGLCVNDPLYNSTLPVAANAIVNGTSGTSGTSATGTSATVPASSTAKSEGRRNEVLLGSVMAMVGLALVL